MGFPTLWQLQDLAAEEEAQACSGAQVSNMIDHGKLWLLQVFFTHPIPEPWFFLPFSLRCTHKVGLALPYLSRRGRRWVQF